LIAYVSSGIVNLIRTETPDFSNFIYLSTDISGAVNPAVRWKTKTNQNQIILTVEMNSGSVNRYVCNDLTTGACTLSTVLGTGITPALAINKQGSEFHFFRTSDSGGSIKRVGIDNAGNIFLASSIVVTGNVASDGIAAYTYDNKVYLIYNHTTNGITVLVSDDYGVTFS
jgi:hypothetical protein